jgi:hypothetical protein
MPTVTQADECTSASGSDDDCSLGDEDEFVSDIVRRDGEDEPPSDAWTFNARSSRGAAVFAGLSKKISNKPIELKYNASDEYLLLKMKKEVKHLLHAGRVKLHGVDRAQPVTPLDAFACALPPSFLVLFKEWLLATDSKTDAGSVTFSDIIEFLRGEIVMRIWSVSHGDLKELDMSTKTIGSYDKVRKAMIKADRPASHRQPPVDTAGIPADTFDPIMRKVIESINDECRMMYFLSGVSSVDLDDDKLPFTSYLWTQYGMKRTPTKEKKLKPVFHVIASTGSGQISHICPDVLGLKLSEMLEKVILFLIPSEEHRPLHAFFIDRGYLELAKEQNVDVSNLIQIMRRLGVKFLGTIKDSFKYPFYFVEVNEDGKSQVNKRAVMQLYGMRNSWTATTRDSKRPHDIVQASAFRHGQGKNRAARIATNMPELMKPNTFVYETRTNEIDRWPNEPVPTVAPLPGSKFRDFALHDHKLLRSRVYQMVRGQGGPDWMAARPWRFSSTSFHVIVNVRDAEYFNSVQLRELHSNAKDIIQIQPTKTVTFENVADLDDDTLPSQKSGLQAKINSSSITQARHSNCTPEYWLRVCKTRATLRLKCIEYGIGE